MSQYTIAVVSDIHYMDPSLLSNKAETFNPFISDRTHKAMLEYSAPIFEQVVDELLDVAVTNPTPDLVLIPGDLTKDGELVNHQALTGASGLLTKLQKKMKVFVVPGSCDIDNPAAFKYDGKTKTPVDSINKNMFKTLYKKFGYDTPGGSTGIIATDPNSLSYLAKASNDLWILAIDTLYNSNWQDMLVAYPPSETLRTGRISPATMKWIYDQMSTVPTGVTVLGLMHYNIIEHFKGQATSSLKKNLVEHWDSRADDLIDMGLKFMFTGRHANDITSRVKDTKKLYDIATGSLVTPPSPYRIITLTLGTVPNTMKVETRPVQSVKNVIFPGIPTPSFVDFSRKRLKECIDKVLPYPEYRDAFMAYVEGDEAAKVQPTVTDMNNLINKVVADHTNEVIAELTDVVNFWTDTTEKEDNNPAQPILF